MSSVFNTGILQEIFAKQNTGVLKKIFSGVQARRQGRHWPAVRHGALLRTTELNLARKSFSYHP